MIINVSEHLARQARERPTVAALHVPVRQGHRTVTFRELNGLADSYARGLVNAGIVRGTRTVLMVPPSVEFFALTFALFKIAAVPVLIDPGMGVKNLGPCLATAEPEAFIGIAKAHVARWLFGWGKPTIKTTVNVGSRRFFCKHSTAEFLAKHNANDVGFESPAVTADDLAAILFTSGSTGPAKGVEYTHGIFAAQVEMLKSTYGIEPGEVDFCSFPLFALFGPALGMSSVVPDMDASRPALINPRIAVSHINQFSATNLFGSPSVIRALGLWGLTANSKFKPGVAPAPDPDGVLRGTIQTRLPTVRRAISAGAPARADEVELFCRLLKQGIELFTPYGATESLPVANIGSREILTETRRLTETGHGVCIGRPVQGMRVDVIRISDDPIAEWDDSLIVPVGEVGEFVVRGPVVTKRYYNNPEATRKAKIIDTKTDETLHRMGDVGYRDEQGRLWFCGRKSHRVVTSKGTLFTDMVEPIFNMVDYVARTALVGVTRGGITYPVLCWQHLRKTGIKGIPAASAEAICKKLTDIAAQSPKTESIRTFLEHPAFPMDVRHNSKIFREKLAVWADKTLGPQWNGGPV